MSLKFNPRLRTAKQKLIVSCFLVLGPLVFLGSLRDQMRHNALVKTGVKTTARVVEEHLEHASKGADRYRLEIKYKPVENPKQERAATLYLYEAEYEAIRGGGTLPVIYSKSNPEEVEFADASSGAMLGLLGGGVMVAVALWGIVVPSLKKAQ
jgi:hypothetical protein